MPRVILKKTSRRTQAVVVSEGIFCAARCVIFLSTEHEGLSTHVQREYSAEPFMPSILSLRILRTQAEPFMPNGDCDAAIAKAAAAVTHVQSQSQEVGSGDERAEVVVF